MYTILLSCPSIVESVYQWVIKINENVEDIGYHIERLTSGVKDSVEPLLPPLIVQYNNEMNSIKVTSENSNIFCGEICDNV